MSAGNKMPSAEEIDAARTTNGGWAKAQLAEWGVPWPPPKGWRAKLLAADDQKPQLKIGDRVPMPPKPKLVVKPMSFVDDPKGGPRGVFTNGRGGR